MNELAEEQSFLVAYPGAIAVSKFFKMLELVQWRRPATGQGRAFSDRRNHSTNHG